MIVLKFGGSSLKSAERINDVCQLIQNRASDSGLIIVLSAPGGITNLLFQIIEEAQTEGDWLTSFEQLQQNLTTIVSDLQLKYPHFDRPQFDLFLQKHCDTLNKQLQGIALLHYTPDPIKADIISLGERFSVQIMRLCFESIKQDVNVLHPEEFLVTSGDYLENDVDLERSQLLLPTINREALSLMPGFIGRNSQKELVVLGRNGSDYSAAAISVLFNAYSCEIWTDVNGAYTADPRFVTKARHLETLSYKEAIDISYFGAKVLHPKTIAPLAAANIPCLIKNTNDPRGACTRISHSNDEKDDLPIKAICDLRHITVVIIAVSSQKRLNSGHFDSNLHLRVQSVLSPQNIPIILFISSSSTNTLTFAIQNQFQNQVQSVLEKEFELELKHKFLFPVQYKTNMAILSVIGDNMRARKGVASTIFESMAKQHINISAIAQGATERNISILIEEEKTKQAVKALHDEFFSPYKQINCVILGLGAIGLELINIINTQQNFTQEKMLELKIVGVANSKKMLFDGRGLDLNENIADLLNEKGVENNLALLSNEMNAQMAHESIIIDATSSTLVAENYIDFLQRGLHVVCANKKANTMSMAYYHRLRQIVKAQKVKLLYETNVGAGLPVMTPLSHLFAAGDQLQYFCGILSGSLSYIFGELDKEKPFSDIVADAMAKKFTEPDPRDDLSGHDVARKLLLIAREAGFHFELENIKIESVLPPDFNSSGEVSEFCSRLSECDQYFKERCEHAKSQGKVLRYVAEFSDYNLSVGIRELDKNSPLGGVTGGENGLEFLTNYYSPIPMTIRGYGAGTKVTASGLYSDILRIVS